jgi:hypothetical protein
LKAHDTKNERVFEEVKSYFKGNHILFENMTACSIDGAA